MAMITTASETTGRSERSTRGSMPRMRPWRAPATLRVVPEGGVQDLLLGQLIPRQVGHDGPLAEHIDVVAVLELVCLGRVPEERAAAGGLLADEAVDFALRAHVDTPHGIVHEDD